MSESTEYSRAMLLGSGATGLAPEKLEERLDRALAVMRVDPTLPGALLTARVLLTTLRRLPGRLALDRTGLADDEVDTLAAATATIDSSRPVEVVDGLPEDAAARVYIGVAASPGWLRVFPDGYGAQVVNDDELATQVRSANALGSVSAAAFAAAEVFKRTARVLHSKCTWHTRLSFCPVTLSADTTLAPELPTSHELDVALVGNGAIGTAVALILAELALGGCVILCDPERFGRENRGTYSLGGEAEMELEPWKVDMVGDFLEGAGYEVKRVSDRSSALITMLDEHQLAAPRVALTGLDSPEARREAQGLWCDRIIDGQTGNTAAGLVSSVPDGPCLRCFFPERTAGPDPLEQLSAESGLSVERLRRGDEPLREDEIGHLAPEQQKKLRAHVGRPTCGLASALGLTDADGDGFRPAVPFVSQMAACLVVGRLLAVELGLVEDVNWFQMDALRGPMHGGERRNARRTCICQTRPEVIRQVRQTRGG